MTDLTETEWPREIWMGEREEHDQGVVTAALSEHATVARWEGDKERDREFHRYIDADIHDSAERYYREIIEAQRTWLAAARAWIAAEWEERGEADAEYPVERRCADILGRMP